MFEGQPVPSATTEAASPGVEAAIAAAAPAEPAAPAAPKETVSAAFSAITKERRKILDIQKRTKAEQEQTRLEREAIAKERAEIEEHKGRMTKAKTNPVAALEAAGWSYKDATEFVLNNGNMTPDQQIAAVREELKAEREAREKSEQSRLEQEMKSAESEKAKRVEEFKESINEFLTTNAEAYELTALYGGNGLVYNKIVKVYNDEFAAYEENGKEGKPPRVLTTKEAADLVEKDLEEELEKVTKTKKFQSRLNPQTPKSEEQRETTGIGPGATKTLSNAATTSSAPARNPARTEAERIQRALEAADLAMQNRGK